MSGPVDTVDGMPEPAIEAIELVKRFGDNTAVDGVSFTVRAGHRARASGPERRGQDHASG